MEKLSVAIITFNEEKNIERCLQSVANIADEIIVIDSLSTDATEAICTKHDTKFIKQSFLGYIEQKNLALSHCTHKMVLCLDADEALSEDLLQSIKTLKQQGFKADGYIMKRCSYFMGKWIRYGTWYPDKKIRLVHKEKAKWGGTNPHDELLLQTNNKQFLNADILHYSYNSLEEVITQNNKFTTIQAKAMHLQGKKSNWFKILINPCIAFINGYFFKLGFLDGWRGFFIAKSIAYQTFCKYIKLKSLG
jgi:glycosyltransferase involved in cell wall biosynthesis